MILAINTSTRQFSLALLQEDGTVLGEYLISKGEGHFGQLMPLLDFMFTASRSDIHDVAALVVAAGPGSFTGLRVGLSAAKGLCHALEIPIIGVSSLEALASQLPYTDIPIAPILDSRKGELFVAQFIWNNDRNLVRNMKDTSLNLEAFSPLFKEPTIFIGNDFPKQGPVIREMLGHLALLAPPNCWSLRSSAVGFLGLKRFHVQDFDDPQSLSPLYLRPPDIRPNPFPLKSSSR